MKEFPTVTVLIPHFKGLKHLQACLNSLLKTDYPQDRFQILVIDNGSPDSSKKYLNSLVASSSATAIACGATAKNQVNLLDLGENMGFAEANNRGARIAQSEYLVFLNDDLQVHPNWLKPLLEPLIGSSGRVCSGAKILDAKGETIDYAGGAMNLLGLGFQLSHGEKNQPNKDLLVECQPTFFACGAAMAIRKEVFVKVSGFDSDYFAFFEDVDLGWRLWMFGYEVLFCPNSIVYHHHHGTARYFPPESIKVLQERNALFTIVKNYAPENMLGALSAALLLAIRRGCQMLDINWTDYSLEDQAVAPQAIKGQPSTKFKPRQSVARFGLAYFKALEELLENWDKLIQKRKDIQSKRKRTDAEILKQFGAIFYPSFNEAHYFWSSLQIIAAVSGEGKLALDSEDFSKAFQAAQDRLITGQDQHIQNLEKTLKDGELFAAKEQKAIKELKTHAKGLEKALTDSKKHAEALEKSLKERIIHTENLETSLAEKTKYATQLQKAFEELSTHAKNLEKTSAERHQQILDYEKSLQHSYQAVESYQKALEDQKQYLERLEKEVKSKIPNLLLEKLRHLINKIHLDKE